ncbi:unnamed protein product [Acanthoscelides obtectus]|uniref:Uncharacterized protein n=1 Tax=Acanthoscelides obtectus TaxID=200917 RepID=A0A9P0PX11_ACAOB|nr:unnamed protein product [Acanthoscelides obtectus]CAK1644891.1 CCR4-NOT transcription complex subunit 4 [Acanthoscelides obtectus]
MESNLVVIVTEAICRFCWHRIRTDENGLCPACRKAYSENPADFIPLSQEQVAKLKAEKRQRDQQRKVRGASIHSRRGSKFLIRSKWEASF